MAATTLSAGRRDPRPAGPHGHHRRALPLRVDDRPLRPRRPARACWPTTCGRSTGTPIRSVGGDAVASWIGEAIANVVWQHHLLSVYHVEVDGDRASALVYHTSHQVFEDDPDTAKLLVGPLPQRAAARARRLEDQPARARDPVGRGEGGRRRLSRADRRPRAAGLTRRCAPPSRSISRQLHAAQPARGHGPRARDPRGRAAAARGRRVLAPAGGRRRGDAHRRRHGGRAGVDVAAQDHDRGVAPRGGAGDGRARGGDPRRGRGRGVPARAPRPRDDRRRAVVPPGGAVGGALAARADAAAAAERRRARRDRRGLPQSRRSTPPRPGSRSSSCTPRTATCSRSSCRRRRTAGPAPRRSTAGSRSSRASCARSASSAPQVVVGIRLSTDGGEEAGLTVDGLCELLPHVSALVDYVNLTVGVRTTYVRDMATEEPPLLGHVGRIRQLVDRPLLISHAFRTPDTIDAALAAGADLVGMARALIADPDMPRKLLGGRAADIRPCVACNEDCRAFDPVLLCSVNPELGPPGADRRPAAPLVVRRAAEPAGGRVAIVGAGPAGLECALDAGRPPRGRAVRRARGDRRAARRRGGGAQPPRVARAAGLLRARARRACELRLGIAGARGRPRRLRRGGARGRQHRGAAGPAGHRARAAVVGGASAGA